MKLALTMILSGNEDPKVVRRCLNSVVPWVDGAFITVTTEDKNNLVELLKEHQVDVDYQPDKFYREVTSKDLKWLKDFMGADPMAKYGDKLFQFDKARNHSLNRIPKEYDWYFWLDADDIVRGADKLHQAMELAEVNKAQAVFINYLYQVELDKENNIKHIIIEHLRERLIKNNGLYEWLAPIHETLIEKVPSTKVKIDLVDVVHLSDEERRASALHRNIKTLELSLCDTKGSDPRPVYYLGKAYFDLAHHFKKEYAYKLAQRLFEIYLFGTKEYEGMNRSGWAEERAQCWEYMMEIHRHYEKHDEALKCGMESLLEADNFPSTYINIALSHLLKGNFQRALHWITLSAVIKPPESTLVRNPKDQTGRALEVLYNAYLQLNKLDEANKAAHRLLKMFPDSEDMAERAKFTDELKDKRELIQSTIKLTNYLISHGSKEKVKPLLMSLPENIKNTPFIQDIEKEMNPPREWQKDEIALFCGPGFTPWSPKILDNPGESFIGGSEEAVIYLSRELQKQGWKVTVYADPVNDEGEHNGVMYLPYYKFNEKDRFNVLVIWRQPGLVDKNFEANKLYVWCHDIQNQADYSPERLDRIDKVIVLSPWHRSNIPNVPDDKILISGNGISL